MTCIIKKLIGIGSGSLLLIYILTSVITTFVFITVFLKRPDAGWPDPSLNPSGSRVPYLSVIEKAQQWLSNQQLENVSITSFDGLSLAAQFLPHPDAKGTILFMHGYHSRASFEFAGFYEYFYNEGYNILLCDQRSHGNSGGTYLTFGINERYDCRSWITWLEKKAGNESPVWLCGVSMGSSTVLMTLGFDLPSNVKGVIADCGFTSPEKIVSNVIKTKYHLPATIIMPFINAGTRLVCGFDLNSYTTLDALKNNTIPILFVHGTNDNFVPFEMSEENYRACKAPKVFLKTTAEHAANFLSDPETYKAALKNFMKS